MILLFLGSWRSTLIVATSIPLSILTSIIVLWALGYSLNTMTLGGMALAVGILVDDATVEIENVHRNLGMKKPLRRAILDGAAQIATPAFVSTLAICIVFVPVVFLTGPAAYLFTPLALAVVFAMLASYFLSRTLVPTMVLYLLPKEAEAEAAEGSRGTGAPAAHPVVGDPPSVPVPSRVQPRLRAAAAGLPGPARLGPRPPLRHGGRAAGLRPGLAGCCSPGSARTSSRAWTRASSGCTSGRRPGRASRRPSSIFGQVEDAIREVVPDSERAMILDNIGLTQSFTIMAYVDNGTVSDADGEILVSLKPDHRPTADYVARLRDELPRRFPGCTFFFEPADITSQILNFGLPAPIDVQVVGVNREANLAVAQKLRQEIAKVPGTADVHLHQITDVPDLRLNVDRIMASELGLTQQDVAGSVLVSLSSTTQVSPNFWVNPENRVNYRVAVQTPEYRIHSVDTLMSTPIIKGQAASARSGPGGTADGDARPADPAPRQPGGPAPRHRRRRTSTTTTSSRSTTSTPTSRAATSGPSRPTCRRSSTRPGRNCRAAARS